MAVCRPGNEAHGVWGVSFSDDVFDPKVGIETKPCLSSTRTRGWVCPATELIGIPLYIAPAEGIEYVERKDLDTICHFLMMDPDSGFTLDR